MSLHGLLREGSWLLLMLLSIGDVASFLDSKTIELGRFRLLEMLLFGDSGVVLFGWLFEVIKRFVGRRITSSVGLC